MSWNPLLEPGYPDAVAVDAIETLIVPRSIDLGGFEVRRALPATQRQMVGPFIFFDHVGPAEIPAGQGADVRPHPHIGLATVTYLFLGEVQHRDSVGSNQIIRPGDVNWMVAGRGITHSERTPAETRKAPHSGYGIQTWVALPEAHEDVEPQLRAPRQGNVAGHRERGCPPAAHSRPGLWRNRARQRLLRHILCRRPTEAGRAHSSSRRP